MENIFRFLGVWGGKDEMIGVWEVLGERRGLLESALAFAVGAFGKGSGIYWINLTSTTG